MTLSPIFEFADRFVAEQSELDPCLATSRGIPGHDDRLTDYSPEGHESRANHMRLALTELGQLTPADEHDRLAKDFITERFETALLAFDAGEWQRTGGAARLAFPRLNRSVQDRRARPVNQCSRFQGASRMPTDSRVDSSQCHRVRLSAPARQAE